MTQLVSVRSVRLEADHDSRRTVALLGNLGEQGVQLS
jgi:hypothetical protein